MNVMKVIEVLSDSEKSFEDAVQNAIDRASKSVDHIRSAYINEQSVTIEGGKIKRYRVNVKITFEVK